MAFEDRCINCKVCSTVLIIALSIEPLSCCIAYTRWYLPSLLYQKTFAYRSEPGILSNLALYRDVDGNGIQVTKGLCGTKVWRTLLSLKIAQKRKAVKRVISRNTCWQNDGWIFWTNKTELVEELSRQTETAGKKRMSSKSPERAYLNILGFSWHGCSSFFFRSSFSSPWFFFTWWRNHMSLKHVSSKFGRSHRTSNWVNILPLQVNFDHERILQPGWSRISSPWPAISITIVTTCRHSKIFHLTREPSK